MLTEIALQIPEMPVEYWQNVMTYAGIGIAGVVFGLYFRRWALKRQKLKEEKKSKEDVK